MPPRKRTAATKSSRSTRPPNEVPAEDREPMDEPAVRRALQDVLTLQARSIVEMALLAGSVTGLAGLAVRTTLRDFAAAEVDDTVRLAEKLVAVGGRPGTGSPDVDTSGSAEEALARLVEHEQEGVAALHAVIGHSGQEPRSEALEHLLEHVIMRKQQQVDLLQLALR